MGDHAAPFDQKDETAIRLLRIAGAGRAVPGDRAARTSRRTCGMACRHEAESRPASGARHGCLSGRRRHGCLRGGTSGHLRATGARISLVALVATIDQLEGLPRRLLDPDSVTDSAIRPGDSIRAGEWNSDRRTGTSRPSLSRWHLGTARRSVTSAAVVGWHDRARRRSGVLDTERDSGRFEVRTPVATACDLGTQFEVPSR